MYVLDTNVLVAALRSRRGASFLILEALIRGEFEAMASGAMLLEYEEVLRRDEQLANFWISPDEISVVVGVLAAKLCPVSIYFQWRPQLRDPDDEIFLECAVNGMARGIVTFNKADFFPAAERFGMALLTPGELVRALYLTRRGPS